VLVEKEILGYSENELAQRLLQSWELPESIRQVIGCFPEPETAPVQLREQAAVLQFAQVVANMSGIGSTGVAGEMDLENTWLVNQGSSPLARPELREKALLEILETFRKRAMSVVGTNVNLGVAEGVEEELDSDVAANNDRRSPAPLRSPKRDGFFTRIKKAFVSLFR